MASRRDKRVASATTKLGRTIAGALRSWATEVGADDIASDVMDRVREGFDVVRDRATKAAGKGRTTARRPAKTARGATKKAARKGGNKAAKKAPEKARSAATPKTTRKTTTNRKTVRKKS